MILKETLKMVALDQRREFDLLGGLVPRELAKKMPVRAGSSAVIVKGVRRCGKSTLLKQVMRKRFGEDFSYANFDDERLIGFEASDFQSLMEVFLELFGERKNVLLDEVQNVVGWELFVNRLLREGYAVFVTGSNANLLSEELGTHLTGRHVDFELYPFSFKEFLSFKNKFVKTGFSTREKVALLNEFEEYLFLGGMPEAVAAKNPALLGQVFEDVVQKDVVKRYAVRKQNELRSVFKFLVLNAGNKFTFKAVSSNFKIKSPNTVQKYAGYAEETCLVFSVCKHEKKLKSFDKNPRKVYCVDNGFVNRLSSGLNERRGALLENLVAVELKRRGNKFYYYVNKNGSETDFVAVENEAKSGKITKAIQVCLNASDFVTREREEKALLQTLKETGLRDGLVLTLDFEETRKRGGKTIRFKPVWKWLLEVPA